MQLGSRRPVNYLGERGFNGISDSYSHAIDLSAQSAIVVSYLASDTGGGSEGRGFQNAAGSADFGTLNRTPGAVAIKGSTGGARRLWTFTRPSQSVLHHWLWTLDLVTGGGSATLTVDGVAVTLTLAESGSPSGNFGNHTWFFMADGAGTAANFSAGILANIGWWAGTETITAPEITLLGLGIRPSSAHATGFLDEVIF